MANDSPDIIDDLVLFEKEGGKIHFYAMRLHWVETAGVPASIMATNHCPATEWIEISSKPADISKEEIRAEQNRILRLKKYYRTCPRCGETYSVGHFNTESGNCDGCAERHEGVCF